MKTHKKPLIPLWLLILTVPLSVNAAKDDKVWNQSIKNQYFSSKAIQEGDDVITLEAPYRAEDPALVPLKIISKIPQTANKYIKNITVFVDKNPFPLVAEFALTPESGKADLAMRIRVNTYSYIRAVAEMNDGKLYMTKKFVKASGGCSAPIGADLDAAMKRLGKMKFRLDGDVDLGKPSMAQLLISHPNITGMQMDQVTRTIKPSHFVEQVKVYYGDKPILTAKTDIAISADPNFRFYFIPNKTGELRAEISDTYCESPTSRAVCKSGQSYSQSYKVTF